MRSTNKTRIGRLNFLSSLSLSTELYISYVCYDRDCVALYQIEVVHFSINVSAFFDK